MAKEKNASKNSVLVELILSASDSQKSDDALAARIADLVTAKLGSISVNVAANGVVASNTVRDVSDSAEAIHQTDEPDILGEDVLGFLEIFG